VAVFVDVTKDMTVEYYDSFGQDPPKRFMKDIKLLIEKLDPSVYLKLKINRILDQRSNSSSCGYLAILFLERRFKGQEFVECSGYSNITAKEKEAQKLKKSFGYI
jgi:hypothetical protein